MDIDTLFLLREKEKNKLHVQYTKGRLGDPPVETFFFRDL
jgi:hypothetical protein